MATKKAPSTARRPRRARGSITPEEVINGAFKICQDESLDALSMPHLAETLGVGVTSIYWYFKSKEDLLDALTEEAFKRFYEELPAMKDQPWDDVLRAFFTNFRSILRREQALCDLIIMRNGNYTDSTMTLSWGRIEEILEVLVDAGFTEADASYAYFTLSVYTRGCVFLERVARSRGVDPATFRHRTDVVAQMPVLSHELLSHSWSMVSDEDYEFGLENNIRGLQARLDSTKTPG